MKTDPATQDLIVKEAKRLLTNMASMSGYHGTTSAKVVDYFCENWGLTVFRKDQLRNIIFTPIIADAIIAAINAKEH